MPSIANLARRKGPEMPHVSGISMSELHAVEKALAERSLYDFMRLGWSSVEPGVFQGNWHLEAICDHLEAVSKRQIKRLIINLPPRHGKPVSYDAPVIEKSRGRVALRDIVIGDKVLTHMGRFRTVTAIHEQGILPLLKTTTSSGRSTLTAQDHPFLTARGWIEAQHLIDGDVLAVAMPHEAHGMATLPLETVRLLGYLIGDGCTKYGETTVTNACEAVLADVEACAASLDFKTRRKNKSGCKALAVVINSNGERHGLGLGVKGARGPVRQWREKYGLEGATSYTKRAPAEIMAGDTATIAAFMAAYWDCDGSAYRPTTRRKDTGGTRNDVRIEAATVSAGLASDLQHLLLRLGIHSMVRKKTIKLKTKRQGETYTSWRVVIGDQHNGWLFRERVGALMRNTQKNGAMASLVPQRFDQTLIPDALVSVEPAGEGPCRCLTVDEDHSFTSDDLVVHNSLAANVFWPAWNWLQDTGVDPYTNRARALRRKSWLGAGCKFTYLSYVQDLSTRDSVQCRRLIDSIWYQQHWPDRFSFTIDQNTKTKYINTTGGYRMAMSLEGKITGEGADIMIIDDPHNVTEIEQPSARLHTLRTWDEALITRLNDPEWSAFVVIMQRTHEDDLAGHILAKDLGHDWTHLCLPARFEAAHPFPFRTAVPRKDGTRWRDPRAEGQPLWPDRWTDAKLDEWMGGMGRHAAAGQLQQRPAPREGGLFKLAWFAGKYVDAVPLQAERVRAWDLAGTESSSVGDPDWTTGVLMAKGRDNLYYIEDVIRVRQTWHEVKQTILAAAENDAAKYGRVHVRLPQDPSQAGKAQANDLIKHLAGFSVAARPVTGEKEIRARPFAAQAEAGNVRVKKDSGWNPAWIDELCVFPNGKHDDQVDATADAFIELTQMRKVSRIYDGG